MALVELRNVTKHYYKGGETIAPLSDVSLDISEGEFVSLMGASGTGKSTLLNLVAGIDRPDSGSIVLNGTDITRLSRSRLAAWRAENIGYIFQTHNLVPVLTAYENIELPLLLLPLSRSERRKRVDVALQAVRDFELLKGSWSDFLQRQDAAMVGSAVAERRQLEVGGKFSIGGVTVSVAGVHASDDSAEKNYVYTGLDFLQRGNGWNRVGTVTQFEVMLEEGVDSIAACQQIDEAFRSGPVQTTTRPKGAFQAKALGDLAQCIGMADYLGYGCVALVLILVATTTVMSVQDRVKEHAVLETIGFSGRRVFCLILAESVLLSLVGDTVGVASAWIVLQLSGLAVGAEGVMMAFQPSLKLVIDGLAISLLSGLLAGMAPAWQAARTEIAAALRHT